MDKLWVDKYRPKTLQTLDYNDKITNLLQKLAQSQDLPHLLFYGPNGAGKKTRIMAFLNEIYGPGVHKLKSEMRQFKVNKNSSTTAECNLITSNYHLDITPSDAEQHDKTIVQQLIKEVAQTHQLDKNAQKNFKIITINECDKLTKEAQAGLRRTMEKYVAKCRLILVCENIGRVIQPLRSRCLLIRVPGPDEEAQGLVLQKISGAEGFMLPEPLQKKIIDISNGNMRSSILNLQTCKMKAPQLKDNSNVYKQEWIIEISNIAKEIAAQQTPQQLGALRNRYYELIVNCIPGEQIMKQLCYQILDALYMHNNFKIIDEKRKQKAAFQIIHYAAHHENQLQLGSKAICHIEAFTAQVMVIFKKLRDNIPL